MSSGSFFEFHRKVTRRRHEPRAAAALDHPTSESPAAAPLTVSQLTSRINGVLRAGLPQQVIVKGEVSNANGRASSGHLYFTLKDATACIDCVLWRDDAARVKFQIDDGLEVLATGRIGVYAQRGRYQLYVNELRPLGQGALELAFRQLREKLEREGLFAPERKREIPKYPRRIVLVTSRQTAALQDMLKVLRRYPWLQLYVYHVPVQGDGAAQQIAAALLHVDRHHHQALSDGDERGPGGGGGGADVLLLARGGGSLEDLWCFNEETLARAIFRSGIPIVTGIGHEVDTSIADLVADHHAHTPTEAAQMIVQHWRLARDLTTNAALRLRRGVRQVLTSAQRQLAQIERHETFRRPLFRVYMFRQLLDDRGKALQIGMSEHVRRLRRRLDEIGKRVDAQHPSLLIAAARERLRDDEQALASLMALRLRRSRESLNARETRLVERHPRHRVRLAQQHLADLESRFRRLLHDDIARRSQRLDALARQLQAIGPERVLQRGFSLTFRKKDGTLIRSIQQIKPGDRLVTRFADGQAEWTAEDAKQMRLF